MQHSNDYSNVKNIDHSIKSLNARVFNCKIGSPLQIAPFFSFYQNSQPPLPAYFGCLILPNAPPPSPYSRKAQKGFVSRTNHFHTFFTQTGHGKLNILIKQVKYCFSDDLAFETKF